MTMIAKSRISELWQATNQITSEIERWLHTREAKTIPLRFKAIDQARLLRLRVWSVKYYIPIIEILDILIPELRLLAKKKNPRYAIGVSISMLCGSGAEKLLRDKLSRRYPDSEHFLLWREHTRDAQLEAEAKDTSESDLISRSTGYKRLIDAPSVLDYVQQYESKITEKSDQQQIAVSQKWRRRKAYRGNPFR